MKPIDDLRKRIDTIDDEMLALLHERISIAGEIGEVKARRGLPILDLRREAEILKRVRCSADICLDVATTSVFREIFKQSRRAQERVIEDMRNAARSGSRAVG